MLMGTYGMPKKNIFFSEYNDGTVHRTVREIRKRAPSNSIFVFSDLCIGRPNMREIHEAIKYLKSRHNLVFIIDHHHWERSEIDNLARYADFMIVGENRDKSAGELVHTVLCNDSKRYAELAKMVHLSDFALRSKKYDRTLLVISQGIKQILNKNPIPDKVLRDIVVEFSKGTTTAAR